MGSVGLNSITSSSAGGGIDVQGIVDQIIYSERAPERLMQAQQTQLNSEAAALRDINSKLTDLQAKVDSLNDLSGNFNAKVVTSSAGDILTASASGVAQSGSHTVVVNSLATVSSAYTDQLASSSDTFSTGSFDLQVGSGAPTTITVDATNNTLDGLATYLNELDIGVTASVITDAQGSRLALVSNASGQSGDLTLTNNTTGLVFNKGATGTNASLTVDGVPVTSDSNTVAGVIPGVTLNLVGAASGTSVLLTVKSDTTSASSAINDFVTSYNAVVQAINAQFTFNSATGRAGVLSGSTSLRMVQQQVLSDIAYSTTGNGGFVNLSTIGVQMADDGTLSVDSSALNDALQNHFAEVQNLFQSTSPSGFARNFSADLDQLTDSVNGPLNAELNGITRNVNTIADGIQAFEDRIAQRQQQLIDEYSRIDALVRQIPLMLQQINSQLGSLQS